jgi:hypothetical protein
MDIRISIFDFLFIEHLTQVGDFSPSVDSGATVDHYNDLKLYFHVSNFIVESNELSKSSLEVEIGRYFTEISPIFLRKISKIATFRKNQKN